MAEITGGTSAAASKAHSDNLKILLNQRDSSFFARLSEATKDARTFVDLTMLSALRKKALRAGMRPVRKSTGSLRVAVIGGCSLFPLHDFLEHYLTAAGHDTEFWIGDYDNYVSEIMEEGSLLHAFKPDLTFLVPSDKRCSYQGSLADPIERQRDQVLSHVEEILNLCRFLKEKTETEIILANFVPHPRFDPGTYRNRTLGSLWNFRKSVNLELGLRIPSYVQICDVEFLATRIGAVNAVDEKGWFETKQPYSPDMLLLVAKEAAHLITSLKSGTKKVLVLDLDNTIWGGVIGDDGLDGIELGDTSAGGEAYKAFQKYLLSLSHRGVVLCVCSKNDYANAVEPFEKHPEMVLRLKDIACFEANWNPKPDNIRKIAAELNLGLDSLVFVDDNPAEIEIVKQFVPEVEAVLLGPDPSRFMPILQDTRFFEPRTITPEDADRARQYKREAGRRELMAGSSDLQFYLRSLEMKAAMTEFVPVDVARIAQLINKSNQFNLTTRRRTEAQVHSLLNDERAPCFTVRLSDKFGDHGLIAVVITRIASEILEVDTWLMSCRVLKRGVEEETLNEIARLAKSHGCRSIRGTYIATQKNGMVRNLYPEMGFRLYRETPETLEFELETPAHSAKQTEIEVMTRAYDAG